MFQPIVFGEKRGRLIVPASSTLKVSKINGLGILYRDRLAAKENRLRLLRSSAETVSNPVLFVNYLDGVNRTARRVPVSFDNAVATICPLSLIAVAELRWYVSAAVPISLLRSVIVPSDQTNATCRTEVVPGWTAGSVFGLMAGR